ncbi:hypothetical protein [Novosphingobium sp. NDB2Meth1]|jgi:hypothetical protein|uniref:hypothetical protein n=1 Tax=Novosphingobium sp. NDB2Meth1 TaxID=1892847 RepID=UPI000930DAAA|nr:hypothetical protein [Novosphingobium sp. NDB2Meth1]
MRATKLLIALSLICAGCGSAEQPQWAKTVAAYEVPLPTNSDKARFLGILSNQAKAAGFHLDVATDDELRALSEVSPITMNAAVWRGPDDQEVVASAMDFKTHIGRVWLTFSAGQDAGKAARFRERLMPLIKAAWPDTASLPITPDGGIPLDEDLVRTSSGYVVRPSAAAKYH